MEHTKVKLREVTKVFNNKRIPLSSNQRKNKKGNFPYYGAQGVIDNIDEYIFDGKYILIAEDGANLETRKQPIARMTKQNEKFWVNNHAHIITSNEKSVDEYLYYYINSIDIKTHVTGSAQPKLTKENLLNIELNLPSLEEQKRIADILTDLDDKIELNNQINQTLEEIASLLYKRWFVDFEFPDDKGNPYKSSGGEMVDSELGMIPKGWEVKKLGEIELIITDFVSNGSFASLKANTKIYKEENYAVFVRNTDLKSGKFETYVDEKTYQFLSKSKLLGGEIIISNVGDVGSVFLCPRINKKMTLGNNVILVKSQESKIYWNYYLYIFLKSSLGKALLESITSGSAQMKFNKTDFKKLKFIAPNFNTLEEFNKIFDKNIFLQNNYKAENTKLQTMKKELLKELI